MMRNGMTGGRGTGGGNKAADTYSDADIATLLYMIEEEKLAGDVYEALYDQTGLAIFDNIAASEDRHIAALVSQADKIGLNVDEFVFNDPGTFVNEELQALYDSLIEMGGQSVTDALEVGKLIEETDIIDLQLAITEVEGTSLANVYDNLLAGSENHLAAFDAALGL